MTASVSFDLPFPAKALWPNGRPGHWAVKARAVKEHRTAAWAVALAAGVTKADPEAPVSLAVTVHPKTRNRPDTDNTVASLKAYIDGLADALAVDDRQFETPSIAFAEPVKGGLLTVTLTYQPFHRSET